MPKRTRQLSDRELAEKLAEGAIALHNLQQNAQNGDSSDSIITVIKKGFNFFSCFHSGGERVLISLSYMSNRSDIKNFKSNLCQTIEQKAPFGLQVSNGCIFLILNPTRNVLLSILLVIGAARIAPYMRPEIYDNLRRLFEGFLGS